MSTKTKPRYIGEYANDRIRRLNEHHWLSDEQREAAKETIIGIEKIVRLYNRGVITSADAIKGIYTGGEWV